MSNFKTMGACQIFDIPDNYSIDKAFWPDFFKWIITVSYITSARVVNQISDMIWYFIHAIGQLAHEHRQTTIIQQTCRI